MLAHHPIYQSINYGTRDENNCQGSARHAECPGYSAELSDDTHRQ